MDSSVGLTIMCAIGRENFAEMLAGFNAVDEHLRSAPLEQNMPVLMGLVGVWNRNLLNLPTVAILPYVAEMARFPAYLQQLEMESNGKHVMLNGDQVGWDTAAVFWGEPGTNGQHAFYQMIHQGTEIVPTEFIGFCDPIYPLGNHHDLLMANMFAQAEALAFGRDAETLRAAGSPEAQISARICLGDRPSTTLLIDGQLTPRALGTLVALYEHRAFTEGVLWGIDSFDQWGVELGKVLAGTLADQLMDAEKPDLQHDSSTNSLARRYRASQKRPV
jgi:glucose-6-phosphate isomerase